MDMCLKTKCSLIKYIYFDLFRLAIHNDNTFGHHNVMGVTSSHFLKHSLCISCCKRMRSQCLVREVNISSPATLAAESHLQCVWS